MRRPSLGTAVLNYLADFRPANVRESICVPAACPRQVSDRRAARPITQSDRCCCLPLPQHEHASADRLLDASAAPADPPRAGCSRRRRRTAPAAAPRSSTAPAARARPDRRSPMPVAAELVAGDLRRRHILEHREHILDAAASRCPRRTARSTHARRAPPARRAVHERRHLAREHALRLALLRRARVARLERRRSRSRSRNVKNFR